MTPHPNRFNNDAEITNRLISRLKLAGYDPKDRMREDGDPAMEFQGGLLRFISPSDLTGDPLMDARVRLSLNACGFLSDEEILEAEESGVYLASKNLENLDILGVGRALLWTREVNPTAFEGQRTVPELLVEATGKKTEEINELLGIVAPPDQAGGD